PSSLVVYSSRTTFLPAAVGLRRFEEDDATVHLPGVPSNRQRRPARLPERQRRRPQRRVPAVRHLRAFRVRGMPAGLRHPLGVRLPLSRVRAGLRQPSPPPRPLTPGPGAVPLPLAGVSLLLRPVREKRRRPPHRMTTRN